MKGIGLSLTLGALIILGAVLLSGGGDAEAPKTDGSNVTMEEGKQVVSIDAKGGYLPRVSVAKAGIPTVVRFNTSGTFDCSAAVRMPSVGVSKILPQTGTTDIDIGVQESGLFEGSCGMGMYPFEIRFVE